MKFENDEQTLKILSNNNFEVMFSISNIDSLFFLRQVFEAGFLSDFLMIHGEKIISDSWVKISFFQPLNEETMIRWIHMLHFEAIRQNDLVIRELGSKEKTNEFVNSLETSLKVLGLKNKHEASIEENYNMNYDSSNIKSFCGKMPLFDSVKCYMLFEHKIDNYDDFYKSQRIKLLENYKVPFHLCLEQNYALPNEELHIISKNFFKYDFRNSYYNLIIDFVKHYNSFFSIDEVIQKIENKEVVI